ncbi:MAG: hypothetical protein R6V10_15375 [bacterium]
MKRTAMIAGLAVALVFVNVSSATLRSMRVGEFAQKVAHKYSLGEAGLESAVSDFAVCGGSLYAGTEDGIYRRGGEEWSRVAGSEELGEVTFLACRSEDLLTGSEQGLYKYPLHSGRAPAKLLDEEDIIAVISGRHEDRSGHLVLTAEKQIFLESLEAPVSAVLVRSGDYSGYRDCVKVESEGYCATSAGLASCPGCDSAPADITEQNPLPYDDLLAIDLDSKGRLLAGTSKGAALEAPNDWHYFQGRQYLPHDRVNAVAFGPEGSLWLGTPRGVSRIEFRRMTLEDKARHMEEATRKRHVRHGLVSDSRLEKPGDLSTNRTATSDNDGLWTAMYIAAECYRYGASGDEKGRENARESLEALMFLETVNGIPGFVSRSFARPDEQHGSGEWHMGPDGKWRWKGDTSSDEIVGHYYAYSIYYDICADEKEKEEIRKKVRLITDYIIDNDFYLIDVDGEPTTWGRWNFKGMRRLRFWDRGLNSLEILSHLKTAYHITGDPKYQKVYLDLALEHDYAEFTVKQLINIPMFRNHSAHELAFLSYYPLLKYEDDPRLMKHYKKSLERSWQLERPEKCPLWNFIYGAVMPGAKEFDLPESVWTLKRISLDLVRWDHMNSHRNDIEIRLYPDRFGRKQSRAPLPPDERSVMKWNGSPYVLDSGQGGIAGGRGGRVEEAGTFWLLPYWMGRYYGFIVEE